MPRIACLVAGAAAVAAAFTASAAHDAIGGPRKEHRHASPHHAYRTTHAASPAVRRTIVTPAVVSHAPAYRHSTYGASRQPMDLSRPATPPVYFVPAISPNAPPFSFSESQTQPGWNWQRVSLQQVDAEVRARRAAQEAGRESRCRCDPRDGASPD